MSENESGAEWTNLEALEAAIGELRETEEECPAYFGSFPPPPMDILRATKFL